MALTQLFSDIAEAIRTKDGTAEPISAQEFPDRILAIPAQSAAPGEPLTPGEVYRATRPADWLPMPEPTDDELFLLVSIPAGGSALLAFTATCTGDYTVSLGTVSGGVFVSQISTDVASGDCFETELSAFDYGNPSEGAAQVLVKVSGTDILTWEPAAHSRRTEPAGFHAWNVVEIRCRLPKATAVRPGGAAQTGALTALRYFAWEGGNQATDFSGMFGYCTGLIAVKTLDTAQAVNMSGMFQCCRSLTAIPVLNTEKVSNTARMFQECSSLPAVPELDTRNVTNAASMFEGCGSLSAAPELELPLLGSAANMFYGCGSLLSVPRLGLTGSIRNLNSLFTGCACLGALRLDPAVSGWAGRPLSIEGCALGREALLQLFRSLPVLTAAKSLTITGNPGAGELTEADTALAEERNWTLVL